MAKPKQIILTETVLPPADLEVVQLYTAAVRAQRQAEQILKKITPAMVKLCKVHPGLLVDGARITLGHRSGWSYSDALASRVEQLRHVERESGAATTTATTFPQLREITKFTGQALAVPAPLWGRLFKSRA